MQCPVCGARNDDWALVCVGCATELQPARSRQAGVPPVVPRGVVPPGTSVPNYLVQAILVTVFCCMPFGVVAIVFAAQVSSRLAAGDYAGAVDASNKARMWCWISFAGAFLLPLIWLLLALVGGLSGM